MLSSASPPPFLPGLELSRRFYQEAVRPILDEAFPGLPYAAARLGHGSDVLGFDTEMSTDHDWGPRLLIFLPDDAAELAESMRAILRQRLPETFAGYPVRFVPSWVDQPPDHWVHPLTVREFAWNELRYDIDRLLTAADWLSFPAQQLLHITAGAVYHDATGDLTALRQRLAYYPSAVWRYLLAAGWQRISQEEHLMPRAGFVGDELGSALIGSRLVRDCMMLGFLMERCYPPYPKWFGTAFVRLTCGPALAPSLRQAQLAATWQERETALTAAYEQLARMHNTLDLTPPIPETASQFFGRPFRVIGGEAIAVAIRATITDPEVQGIAGRRLIGNIDQFSDSTDLRMGADFFPIVRKLYGLVDG